MNDKNAQYEPTLYTLIDEEDNQQTFEVLDTMEVNGEYYYAMTPYYEDPEDLINDDGEFVVLKAVYDENEEFLVTIDDEDEYDRIGDMFIKRLEAMFEAEE